MLCMHQRIDQHMNQTTRCGAPRALTDDENGYTLVEVLVALAILMTVLVPAAQFVGYLVTEQQPGHTSAAYRVAANTLEQKAAAPDPQVGTETVEDFPWTVQTTVQAEGPYVLFRVDVRRTSRERSLVTLETRRVRFEAAPSAGGGSGFSTPFPQ